jgi:hypothetical protein
MTSDPKAMEEVGYYLTRLCVGRTRVFGISEIDGTWSIHMTDLPTGRKTQVESDSLAGALQGLTREFEN